MKRSGPILLFSGRFVITASISSVIKFLLLFVLFFEATLCLHCSVWAFSSCSEQGLPWLQCTALYCDGFSCGAQALGAWASVVVAHGLSCSVACEISLDQG